MTSNQSSSDNEREKMQIPRIALDLNQHKTSIAISWTSLFITSGLIPPVIYFALKYGTSLSLDVVLSIATGIFGAACAYPFLIRSYRLLKKDPFYRPLGGTRWQLDYFHWNFIFGFIYLSALITVGDIIANNNHKLGVRLNALSLPLLQLQVCLQSLIASVMTVYNVKYPFRFSSLARGVAVRPACYTIIEDICAVDGGEGTRFRQAFDQRYNASSPIRRLLLHMDLIWGISGTIVGAVLLGLIWGLDNVDVSFALAWLVPWAWAAILTPVSFSMTKIAKKRESRMGSSTV